MNTKIIFGLVASAMLYLTSCEKKIVDVVPIDTIVADSAITSLNDLDQAVLGVYAAWLERRPAYISSFISDEAKLGTGTAYRNVGNILFNWQHVSDSQDWRDGENGGVWTNMYRVIDIANRAIFYGDKIATSSSPDSTKKQRLLGELYGIRGIAHFELLRHFGSTPEYQPTSLGIIIQTNFAQDPQTYRPARSTQEACVNQIKADLLLAKAKIPSSEIDISRITKNAIAFEQAKLAWWAKEWTNAVTFAKEVLTVQPISSGAAYMSIWTTRALPANQQSEVVFKLNVGQGSANIGSMWQDANGAVQASVSDKLNASFPTGDVRKDLFVKATTTPSVNLILKYGAVFGGNGESFIYDIKVMRSSDVLLARAEAYAELNKLDSANLDLSALRTARISGYVHTNITDKATLVNEIMLERYRELCFEGHRYLDLKVHALPIVRNASDNPANPNALTLPASNVKYILPIPQQEILANPNCQPNPGY